MLTPENKVIFCLSVWVVYSNIDYIQKHFAYKPMTQILSWVVANNFWASCEYATIPRDILIARHKKLSLKNQYIGFVNVFSNIKLNLVKANKLLFFYNHFSHLHVRFILTNQVFYFIFQFFFISLKISMLLVSKNSFMAKDSSYLSCSVNEIPCFIATW